MLKEIAHAAGLSEVAAVFAEGQTNLGRSAVAVVAECFHKDSHALRAISLVADQLQAGACLPLARAFGNGPLNVARR